MRSVTRGGGGSGWNPAGAVTVVAVSSKDASPVPILAANAARRATAAALAGAVANRATATAAIRAAAAVAARPSVQRDGWRGRPDPDGARPGLARARGSAASSSDAVVLSLTRSSAWKPG